MVTYDRRDQRSGGEPVYSILTHTGDAAALLDVLGGPPAVAVSISVSATIAIDLAPRRPDLVRAVVAHESPWRVIRQPPTIAQLTALARMGWLGAARDRHADAVEGTSFRFAYSYRDGGTAWDAFPEEWRGAGAENAQAALARLPYRSRRLPVGEGTRDDHTTGSTHLRCAE